MVQKIKILDVFPIVYTDYIKAGLEDRKKLAEKLKDETNGLIQLDTTTIEKGAVSIESAFDEAINTPFILEKVKWAEKEGYDAVVIDCFGDPGVDAAREIVTIPVVGPHHSAIHLATQLADRFTIINILPQLDPLIRHLVHKYGLYEKLASIRTINVPVLELERDPQTTIQRVVEVAKKAVEEDVAHAVVFGCTGMSPLLEEVQKILKEEYNIDIPVIEPLRAAIYNAVMWTLMGVSHSKSRYPFPREKERIGIFLEL